MNYFLVYHIGHGGGGWLMYAINNHPQHKMWVLGEVHQPNQLDFAGRGIEETPENKTRETLNFFEDAGHQQMVGAGIIKSFTPAIRRWVQEHDGRFIQMVRNPISKCGWRIIRLDRMGQARRYFEKEFGRQPETREEKTEAHILLFRRKFYDHFMKERRTALFPLVRLEDINKSMGHQGKFFIRLMEWLTQVEWPRGWIDHLQRHSPPDQMYINWVRWAKGKTRDEIIDVRTIVDVARQHTGRTKCFAIDPESMIFWEHWDNNTRALYKKYFADVERRLGYNQEYPSSVSQDWEWANRYEWGRVDGRD